MIRRQILSTEPPHTDAQLIPSVGHPAPRPMNLETGDDNSEGFHENIVQPAETDFDDQGTGMVMDTFSPVVENISAQVTDLGERVDILGRVGQTAEYCFQLYENRLLGLEQNHTNLENRCDTAFAQVRGEMDTNILRELTIQAGLQQKFEGLSLHLGEVEANWEERIETLISDMQNATHQQFGNNQHIPGILADVEGLRGAHNHNFETLNSKIAILQADAAQSSGRVDEHKVLIDNWTTWLRKEIARIEHIVQETKETPLLNIMTVLQPQIQAAKNEVAEARDNLDNALAKIRQEINEFRRWGERKFLETEVIVQELKNSDPAARIAQWEPMLNSLSQAVGDLHNWVGMKETECQNISLEGNKRDKMLAGTFQSIESLNTRVAQIETALAVPVAHASIPSTGYVKTEAVRPAAQTGMVLPVGRNGGPLILDPVGAPLLQ